MYFSSLFLYFKGNNPSVLLIVLRTNIYIEYESWPDIIVGLEQKHIATYLTL